MLMTIILLLSAAGAAVWAALTKLPAAQLWQALVAFVLLTLGLSLLFVLSIPLVSIFFPQRRPIKKPSRLCRAYCRAGSRFIFEWMWTRTHVSGTEKLPKDTPFLMVSNHRSLFDPLLVFATLPEYNIAFVSKPENFALPIIGRFASAVGCLPINRGNDREALKAILQAADYIKSGVCSIGIYPEGTRSRTGELLDFHAGSLKIAQRAKAPLAVVSVSGTERIRKNFFRRVTDVYIDVVELIPAEEVCAAKTTELADRVRDAIKQDLDRREGRM